uniref:DUF7597 domain-containing protein n=1 Tax=Oryza brachyantha TaxID=4533 RepID=J3N1J3_ORYBR
MANVNPDPTPFIPPAMAINEAWPHRLPRADLIITDETPKSHEGIAVAALEPPPPLNHYEHFVQFMVEYIQTTLGYHVLDTSRHASEFAYLHLASTMLRDALVMGGPYDVNGLFTLRFSYHDNTITCRESWVMFLDFPLDLQTDSVVDKVVGIRTVRPDYSATARKLAVGVLSDDIIGLAGQTGVKWPVRPTSAQSNRHQLGLTDCGSVGSVSAKPNGRKSVSKGPVRPLKYLRSDHRLNRPVRLASGLRSNRPITLGLIDLGLADSSECCKNENMFQSADKDLPPVNHIPLLEPAPEPQQANENVQADEDTGEYDGMHYAKLSLREKEDVTWDKGYTPSFE